jgi:hypothetical protein
VKGEGYGDEKVYESERLKEGTRRSMKREG